MVCSRAARRQWSQPAKECERKTGAQKCQVVDLDMALLTLKKGKSANDDVMECFTIRP